MRIGIDCRLWNESGVGRYTRNLVKNLQELDKINKYVLFVLSRDYDSVKSIIHNSRFIIHKVDILWHTVEEQLIFPLILNKEKLDLVHFPYFSLPIFYRGKFIVTIHDLIPLHFATGRATTLPQPLYKLKRLGYKFVIKKAAQKAAKIITVSNATKEEIVKHLGVSENKVIVTYEGVDGKILNPKHEIRNYFLYIGNAYPHKNLERLLEAFKLIQTSQVRRLRPARSTIKLVLVGREDYFYKKLREKVRRMKCRDNIIFYGEADDDQLQSLYKNARALVIPSLMEGFGLPALEAMQNKCLVLCSDIAALREVCSDAAIYFNPYDENDIKEKMRSVVTGNFKENLEEGLKRAKLFSWEKMVKQTLAVYNKA